MKLNVNKKEFINKFLMPTSKIVDKCTININSTGAFTLANNEDATIILYSSINTTTNLKPEETLKVNLPDIKKLTRVFECINEDNIELNVNSNNLEYSSNNVGFKYHLLENDIKNVVNVDKIKALTFDTEFTLTQDKFNEVIRGSTFTTDTNKLYFYSKDNKVFAELTDRNIQNVDNMIFTVSESYTGKALEDVLPINMDVFRVLLGLKDDIKVKVNTKLKIIMFDITEPNYTLKYIVSTLIK